MRIPEIAHKYRISESFFNAKDDGLMIAAESLSDLKKQVLNGVPADTIAANLQRLIDFLIDCKQSNY